MPRSIYRLQLSDGHTRLARGKIESGPMALLPSELSIGHLLADGGAALGAAARGMPGEQPVPPEARILAPVDEQEVWAAGVTYRRSRDARIEESVGSGTVYDHVYAAARPELFFKAPGWRVRGPGETIGIRADSAWNVPEPELTLVVAEDGQIAGYTVGNDVSSRTIEGENPLYLPQAKVYDMSCAIGPAIVPVGEATPPFVIHVTIVRDGRTVFHEQTSTEQLAREFGELCAYLVRALSVPHGAFLMTGTGIVPDEGFTLGEGDRVTVRIDGLGALQNSVEVVGSAN